MEGNLHMSYATTRGRRVTAIALVTLLLTALVGTVGVPRAEAVPQSSVIDFETGFSAGDTVATLSVGNGMTGAALGTVSVMGTNPDLTGNSAMIFDATCGGQTVSIGDPAFEASLCSGDDWDLYLPSLGNTLIITEDGDASDPDDAINGRAFWTFDFSSWGPGTVTVDSFFAADIDDPFQTAASASFFDADGNLISKVGIPVTGDNAGTTVNVGLSGVRSMVVGLSGSGEIDNIQLTADVPLIDLELTKDVDPAEVEVGDETTFTITVVNQGPDDATGVEVTDTLPAGLTYVSDDAGGAYDAATGVWTIGDLAVGESVSMEFTVTVDEPGSFTNEAEVTAANEEDSDSVPGDGQGDDWDDATVIAVAPPPEIDLELTKDVAPAAVQVGDETTFTVSVFNRGPDDATGVAVTDTLPAGLTYVSDDAGGDYDSTTGVWTIGDLAVGDTVAMEFIVTVDAAGEFRNVAEVTAANEKDTDSTPGNGTDNDEDDWDDATVVATEEPPPIIDLELTKLVNGVDDVTVEVDDTATFSISVFNRGPNDATGVEVTDTLPAGLTYVSDNAAGAYNAATGVWTIGNLAVGNTVAIEFTVTVDDVGIYVNEAEVTAANEEDSDSVPGDGIGDDWDDATVRAEGGVEASSTIGDYVWYDDDEDQIQDADEDGVAGVTVRITNQATNEVLTQVTNANGLYLFSGLDAGTYLVEVLTSTFPDNHDLTTVGSYTVTVLDDESFLDADFGIVEVLPITGMELETAALIGLLLLAIGGGLLAVENRRRAKLLVT